MYNKDLRKIGYCDGIAYPDDSAVAATTLHCNQKDGWWRRRQVVQETIPAPARRMWHEYDDIQRKEWKVSERILEHATLVTKFDAWWDGTAWCRGATVADGKCVRCEFRTVQEPQGRHGKFGWYHQPHVVFKVASSLTYLVRSFESSKKGA